MAIKIFDSLSQSEKILKIPKEGIKLYVCGPTVYDDMHLGHARTYLAFDIIVRFLRCLEIKIFYLQNITDVDDKIIDRAIKNKKTFKEVSEIFFKKYMDTSKKIGIISVDKYDKASSSIKEIKSQIERLLKKGYAYETKNGVYFDVSKFKSYGELSNQNLEDLRSGYRVEPDPEKKSVFDFALWKKKKSDKEPSWPSPWGDGRPGWHIEDTAIAEKWIGLNYDIHGGGADLKFPHHEAEIAQAESLSGKKPFVKIWMHTGFLLVEGVKMSKSLHNFITVPDFLKNYHPNVLRWLVFSRHYRSPFDYKEELISQAINSLLSLKLFLANLKNIKNGGPLSKKVSSLLNAFEKDIQKAMSADFNTPEVISSIFNLMNSVNSLKSLNKKEASSVEDSLTKILSVFGFQFSFKPIPKNIKEIVEKREVFRTVRNFSEADKIREKLEKIGYKINDNPSGPPTVVFNDFKLNHV